MLSLFCLYTIRNEADLEAQPTTLNPSSSRSDQDCVVMDNPALSYQWFLPARF